MAFADRCIFLNHTKPVDTFIDFRRVRAYKKNKSLERCGRNKGVAYNSIVQVRVPEPFVKPSRFAQQTQYIPRLVLS